MTHKMLPILALASGVLLLILFPVSYHLNDGVAIASGFHAGLFDGNLSFYSDDKPYRGSIVSIANPEKSEARYPVLVTLVRGVEMNIGDTHEIRSGWSTADGTFGCGRITFIRNESGIVMNRQKFCTLPGVYFRDFWMNQLGGTRTFWTFTLSLWYPVLLAAVLPAVWLFRQWRSRSGKP